MVKRPLLALGAATLLAGIPIPAPAHADKDRYIPDLSSGYCPGGKGGRYRSPIGHGYCDGIRYPDHSYWHMLQPNYPGAPTMQCVINPNGDLWPKPAPPGGCGGAV